MKIKSSIFILALLISACSNTNTDNHFFVKAGKNEASYFKDIDGCPKIHIRRDDAAIVQKENGKQAFELHKYKERF